MSQKVHKNCRKDFTRKAYVRKRQAEEHDEPSSTTALRSSKTVFSFRTHWLFCGNQANVRTNEKYKREGQDVFQVRTLLLQDSIKTAASNRDDKWAEDVLHRIQSVVDLPAADAIYHQSCSVCFRTGRGVPQLYSSSEKKKKTGRPEDIERKDAFFKVIDFLENGDEEQVTITCLVDKMGEFLSGQEAYSVKKMKQKLQEYYGNKIFITEKVGVPNVVTFLPTAETIINNFYNENKRESIDDEKMRIIQTAAKLIKDDIMCSECFLTSDEYPVIEEINIETVLSSIPMSLRIFLNLVIVGVDKSKKVGSSGQALLQAARPRSLMMPLQIGLGLELHHQFASKFLIDTLSKLGFCKSYSEVRIFEKYATVTQAQFTEDAKV